MTLPRFGMLDGKQVELTDEFIKTTPDRDLERVTVDLGEGPIRPFKGCRETAKQQMGNLGGTRPAIIIERPENRAAVRLRFDFGKGEPKDKPRTTDPEYRKHLEEQAKNAPPCPNCRSTKIVPIGYGVEAFIASKETDLVVCHGGHIIFGKSPCWHCRECKNEFGVVEPTDEYKAGDEVFVD